MAAMVKEIVVEVYEGLVSAVYIDGDSYVPVTVLDYDSLIEADEEAKQIQKDFLANQDKYLQVW